jgi:hypothetical protein
VAVVYIENKEMFGDAIRVVDTFGMHFGGILAQDRSREE